MTVEAARKVLLDGSEAVEGSHHGHPDFRIANKIFATLRPELKRSVLRLPLELAELYAAENPDRCQIVSRMGGMGWLSIDLVSWNKREFRPLAEVAHGQMKKAGPKKKKGPAKKISR